MCKCRTAELTSHYNKKWNLYQRVIYMKIGQIANGVEYRMEEQFQNLVIFAILIIFQITKKI